jgi:hypothetical protein
MRFDFDFFQGFGCFHASVGRIESGPGIEGLP